MSRRTTNLRINPLRPLGNRLPVVRERPDPRLPVAYRRCPGAALRDSGENAGSLFRLDSAVRVGNGRQYLAILDSHRR